LKKRMGTGGKKVFQKKSNGQIPFRGEGAKRKGNMTKKRYCPEGERGGQERGKRRWEGGGGKNRKRSGM